MIPTAHLRVFHPSPYDAVSQLQQWWIPDYGEEVRASEHLLMEDGEWRDVPDYFAEYPAPPKGSTP